MPARIEVKITGWRYVEKVLQSTVSRDEVVRFTQEFFVTRGFKVASVHIIFKATRKPRAIIDGENSNIMGDAHKNKVSVYPLNGSQWDKPVLFEVLAHELDHVQWFFEGRRFRYDKPYRKQPHEVRAFKTGYRIEKRYK